MTTETEVRPVPAEPKAASKPFLQDRRDQEPRGRWENRCDFAWSLAYNRFLVCDRPTGHKGMHTGRIFSDTAVIGYGRQRV